MVTVSATPTIGGISGKSARTLPPMKPSVRSRTLNGSMALLIVGLSTPLRNVRSCSPIGSTLDRSVIHCPLHSWKPTRRRARPGILADMFHAVASVFPSSPSHGWGQMADRQFMIFPHLLPFSERPTSPTLLPAPRGEGRIASDGSESPSPSALGEGLG